MQSLPSPVSVGVSRGLRSFSVFGPIHRGLQICGGFAKRLFLLAICWLAAASAFAATKPNILLIVADDAGYADFGFQGGGINGDYAALTPNIDRLATNGVRFTSGYVSGPTCSPSRAGLLTGRYQQRFGFENTTQSYTNAGLATNQLTIADHLKPLGYTNYAVGKWHLGEDPVKHHPNRRGFDEFLGFLAGERTYFQCTNTNCSAERRLQHNGTLLPNDTDIYLTDKFAAAATNYLATHVTNHPGSPFFLYLAFSGVHEPLEAELADLNHPAVLSITNLNRRTNAAMTLALDRAVGMVMNQLTNLNLASNTLVVFLSDNGGPEDRSDLNAPNWSDNGPLRDGKTSLYEGGIRVPFVAHWPGRIPTAPGGRVIADPVITLDLLPTFVAAAGGSVFPDIATDGVNLLPRLTEVTTNPIPRCLFWRSQNPEGDQSAVRQGDWKWYRGTNGVIELYDLATDLGESTNLAAAFPEKMAELLAAHAGWEQGMIEPLWAEGAPWVSTPALVLGASPLGYLLEKTGGGFGFMTYELRAPLSLSNDWSLTWNMESVIAPGYARNGFIVLGDGQNTNNLIRAGLDVTGLALSISEIQSNLTSAPPIGSFRGRAPRITIFGCGSRPPRARSPCATARTSRRSATKPTPSRSC